MSSYKSIKVNARTDEDELDYEYVDVDEHHDIIESFFEGDDEVEDYLQMEIDGQTVLIPFSLLLSIAQLAQCCIMPDANETVH